MALVDRSYRSSNFSFGGGLPPGVKGLLVANTAVFAILFLARVFRVDAIPDLAFNFALVPASVVNTFAIWQIVTYSFLHNDVMHILFNALYIWFIGSALENTWGTRRFLQFYFLCAVGGAMVGILASFLTDSSRVPIVGASGACFGLLVAFGVLFAEQTVIFFIFPMKAKYMVLILCGLQFLQAFTPSQTAISVHIGGILTAIAYLVYYRRFPRLRLVDDWKQRYRQYKIERARKKFQVYLRKHNSGSDRDRFIN